MKKYYLSLICAGVILGCAATAISLSVMTDSNKKSGGSGQITAEQGAKTAAAPDNIAPPPETEAPPQAALITPSTKLVFESFYQADKQTKVTDEDPPYFLLGLPREKIQAYYPDWEITEFDENTVKLRRTIPASTGDLFVLGVRDNYVAVYEKSNNGTISLKEMTAMPIAALPVSEQNKLISGIGVSDEAQLAQLLEDYGS